MVADGYKFVYGFFFFFFMSVVCDDITRYAHSEYKFVRCATPCKGSFYNVGLNQAQSLNQVKNQKVRYTIH